MLRKKNLGEVGRNSGETRLERGYMRRAILGLVILGILTASASAEVKSAEKGKFRIEQELILPATPNEVYDAVTGDISGWWDHAFSGHPKKLYVEARPGGGVYEIFDDAGNGALHATVIYADRGKKLRYTGPMGFSGRSIDMVTSYDLAAEGAGTKFHLTVTASGDVDEQIAAAVDGVWHHFLDERLKAYITSGDYKTHGKAVGGAASKENVKDTAPDTMHFTIGDVAFFSGRWTGTAGTEATEEICTEPARGEMSCMFRGMDDKKIDGLEFIIFRESGGGIEERVRFFSGELGETPGDNGITMRLASVTPSNIIFENAKQDGVVKRITVTRRGKDEFGTHIEVVDASGKSGAIDSEWKRAK
jgi:uncharacterized protein YndB with AHSA1/START domain